MPAGKHLHTHLVAIRIPDDVHKRLVHVADGRPLSRIGLRLIRQFLDQEEAKEVRAYETR